MKTNKSEQTPLEILLVEDNPGEVRLVEDLIKSMDERIHLNVVMDGVYAMDYLHKKNQYTNATRPDIILLDLNIPRKNGRLVLAEIKGDPNLRQIPVIVLSISNAEEDVSYCYNMHANCYIKKPFEIADLINIFNAIRNFWFKVVMLPSKKEPNKND